MHALPPTIYNGAVLIVANFNVPCPFSIGAQFRPFTTLKYGGAYYKYDPRIKLLDNTVESPIRLESTSVTGDQRSCPIIAPTAPKTFLNEDTCVIAHGCYPDQYSDTAFELNVESIRQFYLTGTNYVYASRESTGNPPPFSCAETVLSARGHCWVASSACSRGCRLLSPPPHPLLSGGTPNPSPCDLSLR